MDLSAGIGADKENCRAAHFVVIDDLDVEGVAVPLRPLISATRSSERHIRLGLEGTVIAGPSVAISAKARARRWSHRERRLRLRFITASSGIMQGG